MLVRFGVFLAILAATVTPTFAHITAAEHGSFFTGIAHPLSGADHILAMITVGLWAAQLGGRSIWLVPGAFVGTMTAGFVVAAFGLPLPFIEPMILASVIVIGLFAAMSLKVPTWFSMALVGFFAVFHGYAHGAELSGAHALVFAVGFLVSTILLHATGIAVWFGVGKAISTRAGNIVARAAGALAAFSGVWLVISG